MFRIQPTANDVNAVAGIVNGGGMHDNPPHRIGAQFTLTCMMVLAFALENYVARGTLMCEYTTYLDWLACSMIPAHGRVFEDMYNLLFPEVGDDATWLWRQKCLYWYVIVSEATFFNVHDTHHIVAGSRNFSSANSRVTLIGSSMSSRGSVTI